MKKLIGLLILVIGLTSCATDKYLMSKSEFNRTTFNKSGVFIYQDTSVVAEITSVEFELYRGVLSKEISITLIDLGVDGYELIRYLHTLDPNSKIEINTDNFKVIKKKTKNSETELLEK